jgi:hypothetical protein
LDKHFAPDELIPIIEEQAPVLAKDIAPPFRLLAAAPEADGNVAVDVSADRLVPVPSDDPALSDVAVRVPITVHARVSPDREVLEATAEEPDADTVREATAWARNLIATGAVRGVATSAPRYGPPPRPTHELVEDPSGRRIIRRIGFAAF